jgi:glycosyltransferase involved in cell wall biosynthesis
MFHDKSVTLVIPAKNELASLPIVLAEIPDYIDEIIIVDGNSVDGTLEYAQEHPRVSKVIQQRSKGKGAALSAGFANATKDLVVIIDADGSMNLDELQHFLVKFPDCGIVKGSRYLNGGGSSDLTMFRSFGNKVLTKIANNFFHQDWTDLAYGYAAFDRKLLSSLALTNYDALGSLFSHKAYGQGFEIETLMFCRAARRGIKLVEVPAYENDRIAGASNLRAIRDGVRVLIALFVERARSIPREW